MISHKIIGVFTFIANDEFPQFLGFINTQNSNNFELIRLHDKDISKACKLDFIFTPVIQYINENNLLKKLK